MGLLDKIFSFKKIEKEINKPIEVNSENHDFDEEISFIIDILNNLGLLQEKQIENRIIKGNNLYKLSILKRLMISIDDKSISSLKKYYSLGDLGYKENKLNDIKKELMELATSNQKIGKTRTEIVEILIMNAKKYIEEYKATLSSFNSTIKILEENTSNKAELIGMIDYWSNYYKQQHLGYSINIYDNIETMVNELRLLPYGGYGDKEIKTFIEDAYKMIAEAKTKKESSKETLNRIQNTLFVYRKNRYLSDLKALKTKLSLIDNSDYLSSEQKEANKNKQIQEFNIMNGHMPIKNNKKDEIKEDNIKEEKQKKEGMDNSIFLIEVNIEKLMNLPQGGYGPAAISLYRKQCDKIMKSSMSNEDKYIEINKVALLLINIYYHNLEIFTKWKEIQLKGLKDKAREDKNNKLDKKIKYMLSLSPKDLNEYYMLDDRRKRKAREKHNFKAAYSFLAKQEAKQKNDPELYEQRIKELKEGTCIYSDEDIEDAKTQIELLSMNGDNKIEENIISVIDYVDSTILGQMISIESNNTITHRI